MRRARQSFARYVTCGSAALLALMGWLPACRPTHTALEPAAVPAPPAELRVGIAPNYPPLAFELHGKITGVEAEFARKLAPALGVKMRLVETPFEELIPALLAHRIDIIMSGMSITDERKQLVSFAHPYLRVGQLLLLRQADDQRFKDNAAIDRPTTRVAVVAGTTGEAYARSHFPRAHIDSFDGVDAAVAALRAQHVDIFVHDAPSIWRITAGVNGPEHQLIGRYEPLTKEYLAWAVRKNDGLRARLDTTLRLWNQNGTLDAVLNRWISVSRPDRTPTPQ